MQAIGYIRISTTLKRQDTQALEKQAEKIRTASHVAGFDLTGIYEDVGSAAQEDSLKRRPGLQDALKQAQKDGSIIIVTEISRLFRNLVEALNVYQTYDRVRFWSVALHDFINEDYLRSEVAAASAQAEATRLGASAAQISRGFLGPDPEAKARGSKASLQSRQSMAAARVEKLADLLAKHEGPHQFTHAEAAALFNAHGVKTAQGKAWTADNVRRYHQRARQYLHEIRMIVLAEEVDRAA